MLLFQLKVRSPENSWNPSEIELKRNELGYKAGATLAVSIIKELGDFRVLYIDQGITLQPPIAALRRNCVHFVLVKLPCIKFMTVLQVMASNHYFIIEILMLIVILMLAG